MIEFRDVCVRAGEKQILRNVTFSLSKGEKVVIRGKSGSGKTTVLNVLMGVFAPCGGEILFNGTRVDSKTIGQVRTALSYIAQEPLLGTETVEEALYLPFTFKVNKDRKPDRKTVVQTLHKLQLAEDILTAESSTLSGGEKQRIIIARALLLGKEVFILDEVTSALDPESKQAVLSLFSDDAFTILSVSHDPDWFTICDTLIDVGDGKILNVHQKDDGEAYHEHH
jgi:putative ABC transport system ATP-binding protein